MWNFKNQKMDRKINHKLVIYDTPESAKNATLEQVKIATSSKTISVASAPSPTPRNTGNTEKTSTNFFNLQ